MVAVHCTPIMKGHVWEEFASETYRSRANGRQPRRPDRRWSRFYRNVSLVDLWAHAPFLHNNAIGPELCGRPSDPERRVHRSPYVDADGALSQPAGMLRVRPVGRGRYRLFLASVDELLKRTGGLPTTVIDQPIRRAIGPKLWDGRQADRDRDQKCLPARQPDCMAASSARNCCATWCCPVLDSDKLEERMLARVGDARAASAEIGALTKAILKNP